MGGVWIGKQMLVQTIWCFGAFAADVAEPTADMNLLNH